jgi:hypothetical protein
VNVVGVVGMGFCTGVFAAGCAAAGCTPGFTAFTGAFTAVFGVTRFLFLDVSCDCAAETRQRLMNKIKRLLHEICLIEIGIILYGENRDFIKYKKLNLILVINVINRHRHILCWFELPKIS